MRQLITLIAWILLAVSCADPNEDARLANAKSNLPVEIVHAVDSMRNTDIEWDGTFLGIIPMNVGEPLEKLMVNSDSELDELLLAAMEDDERRVAAHVVLAHRHGESSSNEYGWYGLTVDLQPDGSATFDIRERGKLRKEWTRLVRSRTV